MSDDPLLFWRRFSTLEERLKGLLYIEVDDAFLDREHRCVSQLALVVSLNPGPPPTIQQTLDAVATLYTTAESLRGNKTRFNAFWMRVFSSKMVEDFHQSMRALTSLQSTLKCLYSSGFHVKLRWRGQPLTSLVIDAIGEFLHAPRAKYERLDALNEPGPRVVVHPFQVEIEFFNCHLNEADFKPLLELLRVRPKDPHDGATLCERGVLRALRLAGNLLDTAALNALATLLEAPATRRIDSLALINAMPGDETVTTSKQYITAFKQVLVAAFKSKIAAYKDHGFALSLAGNDGLRSSHIAALHEALAGVGVTRPLRALRLACIPIDNDGLGVQIGKLVFDSSALTGITMMDECELDLTPWSDGDVYIPDGLTQLVREATPQVQRALQDDVPVYCRVLPDIKEIPSRTTLHKVIGVGTTTDHLFCIEVPRTSVENSPAASDSISRVESAEPVVVRWVAADDISCVRIGDTDIIRSRFTSFVRDSNQGCYDEPSLMLLWAMGAELKRLALRKYYDLSDVIASAFEDCPRLEELNVKHSQIDERSWRSVPGENWRSLQVLTVAENATCIYQDSVNWLKSVLANVQADLALQHLSVDTDYKMFCGNQVRVVGDVLGQHKSIQEITVGCSFEYFDAARSKWESDACECLVLQKQVDHELNVENLSLECRLAFLSVLPMLATPLEQNLDNGVVAEIFTFAQKPRVVTWY